MFRKKIKQNESTSNLGTIGQIGDHEMTKVTYITLNGIDGENSIKFESKVTIGSEVGDLIVENDVVSPRHCTFYLNKDVVSLMDHSSEEGTFLNKKRLSPGRVYLLSDKDKIMIGNISVEIDQKLVPVEKIDDVEDTEDEEPKLPGINQLVQDDNTIPEMEELQSEATPTSSIKAEVNLSDEMDFEPGTSELSLDESEVKPLKQSVGEKLANHADLSQGDIQVEDKLNEDLEEVVLDDSVLPESVYLEHNSKKKKNDKDIKPKQVLKTKKEETKKKVKTVSATDPASNGYVRLVAFFLDSILCLIILEVFGVYTEFSAIYKELPVDIYESIKPLFMEFIYPYYLILVKEIPQVSGLVNDILNLDELPRILTFLSFVFIIRIISGLVLSKSIGQMLMGIKFKEKFLYKRIMFMIREIIGIILFPFIIFDLPTLISKRSFKEVITRTHYYSESNLRIIFGIFIILPLSILTYTISPVFKGLEILPKVLVEESSGKRRPYQYKQKTHSKFLSLQYDKNENFRTLPDFSFAIKDRKRVMTSGLMFIDLNKMKTLKLEKVKEFSLQKLYEDFTKLNITAQFFQPTIYDTSNNIALKSKNFVFAVENKSKLANEMKEVIKGSFAFEPTLIHEFIMINGPFYNGFRDAREKVESLYDSKIKKINFFNIGDGQFMMTSHSSLKSKKFYFFELGKLKTTMYSFSKDVTNRKNISMIKSFEFNDSKKIESVEDPIGIFANQLVSKNKNVSQDTQQAVYQEYYDICRVLLEKSKFVLLEKLMANIQLTLTAIDETDSVANKKLFKNLSELIEAIKAQDYKFFNINKSKVI